ncbi:FG-GAP repeat domain-containing protein [Roseobacter ponti]|uniref:VCBS repeat-containing protein n=1 Tax=Roseobacter ponti TaxID=1891787 RepID=A0A858SX65_9RHOB|nr:VCBS repeat-containing protein [Roseobacter ponti]QJF52041.1 VCBS repeat-containing protein [Roseobacter ponti]
MRGRARRLLSRLLAAPLRRALLALCLLHGPAFAGVTINAARYEGPTDRYAHAVLGDAVEYITLVLTLSDGTERRLSLPDDLVFEDTAPRLHDLNGDGAPEVVVVESSQTRGARLAVWGRDGRITATPFIGTRFRWLAPLGAADLDGDGTVEIAWIDRPHLAKTLRIWRYEQSALTEVASLAGYTNHRIGEHDIAGGIRMCGGFPEMILATADWSELVALRFDGAGIAGRTLGTDTRRPAFARAMVCAD